MNNSRILASASVFALLSAAGVSGAQATTLTYDLSVIPPTLVAASFSHGAGTVQSNNTTSISASSANVTLVMPPAFTPADVEGGTINALADYNTIFSLAVGNAAVTPIIVNGLYTDSDDTDPGAFVDLKVVTGGAYATAPQLNAGVSITASTSNGHINSAFEDLGTGSSVILDNLGILSDASGNLASTEISGVLNPLFSNADVGSSLLTNPGAPNELVVSGGLLAASTQQNIGLTGASAAVTGSRIGSSAVVDGTPTSLVGINLDLTNNTVRAQFTGNEAANLIDIDLVDGADVGFTKLDGSAGAVSVQASQGVVAFTASVTDSTIEIGNTNKTSANLADDVAVADLNTTTIDFTGNSILAAASDNSSLNRVLLDDVSLDGNAVAGGQQNSFTVGAPDVASVAADLFVQNVQYSDVAVTATVTNGDLNVNVSDMTSSVINATGNSIAATASGSEAVNLIDVTKATSLSGIAAINNAQYTEGLQTATVVGSELFVRAAGDAGAAGTVTGDGIYVDGNFIYAEAVGNSQDSSLEIDKGNTVTGLGGAGAPTISVNHVTTTGGVEADFSVLNAQVLDGGGAVASTDTRIISWTARNGGVGSAITDATVSVSDNQIYAQAIGNLSSESSITIDANSLAGGGSSGTVGLVNSQTVEDGAQLSATLTSSTDTTLIEVDAFPNTFSKAAVNVDDNAMSAFVWGNLVEASTNSITLTGGSISDGTFDLPAASVDRTGTALVTTVDAGFALLNDQSVEDLEGAIVTAVTGDEPNQSDFIRLRAGSSLTNMSNTKVTASGNKGTSAATLNQATSAITVGGDTTMALNGSPSLVNVQSVVDEDNDGSSAGVEVDQYDGDISVEVESGAFDMLGVVVQINANKLLASGRVNLASNTITETAQTQTLTLTSAAAANNLVIDGLEVDVVSEVSLINDQYFENLADAGGGYGVSVDLDNSDLSMNIRTAGTDFGLGSVAEIDGNSIMAQAIGNDATNGITLNVKNYTLTGAGVGGAPQNGPIAMLASNQQAVGEDSDAGLSATVNAVRSIIDMNGPGGDVDGDITGATITQDANDIRAFAQVNTVVNTLAATGTTLPDVEGGANAPTATLLGPANQLIFNDATFGIGSNQLNALSVIAELTGTPGDPVRIQTIVDAADSISNTTISESGNKLVAQAGANNSKNRLDLDFVSNDGQAFVGNVQQSASSPSVTANVANAAILVDADGAGATVITGSAINLNANTIAAVGTVNDASNILVSKGTTLTSSSDDLTPNTLIDPGTGVIVNADYGVINAQGPQSLVGVSDSVSTSVNGATIQTVVDTLNSGTLTVDNNVVGASSTIHGAYNGLGLFSGAAVDDPLGVAGVSASVASQQVVTQGSTASATVTGVNLNITVDSAANAGASAMSVSGNTTSGTAIGGTVTNELVVDSGATIIGGTAAPTPLASLPTANGDFNIVNSQRSGDTVSITSDIVSSKMGIDITSLSSGDAVTVDNNLVESTARGFWASNTISLRAGAASDATSQLINSQVIGGAAITADIDTVDISATFDDAAGAVLNGAVSVSSNDLLATASGSVALNSMTTSAGATLQASTAGGATISNAAPFASTTGVDYAVLNYQSNTGGQTPSSVTATIGGALEPVTIGVDDLSGTAGVDNSAIAVNGNNVLARATGNYAENELTLDTGTFQHPSSAVLNVQTNAGVTVSSTVDNVTIGIGLVAGGNINGASTNSSFTIRGNNIGATSIGNSATNSITGD